MHSINPPYSRSKEVGTYNTRTVHGVVRAELRSRYILASDASQQQEAQMSLVAIRTLNLGRKMLCVESGRSQFANQGV
jgi:hypothetical protein